MSAVIVAVLTTFVVSCLPALAQSSAARTEKDGPTKIGLRRMELPDVVEAEREQTATEPV